MKVLFLLLRETRQIGTAPVVMVGPLTYQVMMIGSDREAVEKTGRVMATKRPGAVRVATVRDNGRIFSGGFPFLEDWPVRP